MNIGGCSSALCVTKRTEEGSNNNNNNNIIMNYNWVVARWQWLFNMYREYEIGVKLSGLNLSLRNFIILTDFK